MEIYQVIVIGGGMSGLAACAKLHEMGVNKIIILEGNHRLGGRIHTIDFGNNPNDIHFLPVSAHL